MSIARFFGFLAAVVIFLALLTQKTEAAAAVLPDETVAATETVTTEFDETTESEVQHDVLDDTKIRQVIEYNLELNQPIETFTLTPVPVYEVNPDDYNGSMISTFAMNADVYNGSYNSTG